MVENIEESLPKITDTNKETTDKEILSNSIIDSENKLKS